MGRATTPSQFLKLARGKFRSPDPFLTVKDEFVLRRIAPDSRKVDLGEGAGSDLTFELLRVMGFDVRAIHAATKNSLNFISEDLRRRPTSWLYDAAKLVV